MTSYLVTSQVVYMLRSMADPTFFPNKQPTKSFASKREIVKNIDEKGKEMASVASRKL